MNPQFRRRLLIGVGLLLLLVAAARAGRFFSYYWAETTTRAALAKAGVSWLSPLDVSWERLSAGRPYSITRVSDPSWQGEDSLRFEVRPGDSWTSRSGATFRSEIDTSDRPPINAVRWYRVALLLPKDFPIEDNRLVLFQWHGADKKYLGEAARSPTLAFRYSGGIFSITMRHSPLRIVHDPDAVPSERLFKSNAFPLGVWNDFVIEAKWSPDADGRVTVWWNGRKVVGYQGPVGYHDDVGPYVQFGLYRDESTKTYVAYLNQVRGGASAAEVGFVVPKDGP